MPAFSTTGTILVTGANGFLAAWMVRTLLDRGHHVVGTVRTARTGEALKTQFLEKEGKKAELFEYAIIPDLSAPGAYDDVVKDVDAIVHMASSLRLDIENPMDVINATVNQYLGLLESVKKYGTKIKRIVITGSDASAINVEPEPKRFDGSEFNTQHFKMVEEKGKATPPMVTYMASKVLSEQAAWDWYKTRRNEVYFDIVFMLPCMFFGPLADDIRTSPDQLPTSNSILWYALCTPLPFIGGPFEFFDKERNYLDVRDATEAHARALEIEEAGGQRFILAAGPVNWHEWVDIAHTARPNFPGLRKIKDIGNPKGTAPHAGVDSSKAESILGMRWRRLEDIIKDSLDYFSGRGWAGTAA